MNPVVEFLKHAYEFHPVFTVVLGIIFFPEIEVVFALLILLMAAAS